MATDTALRTPPLELKSAYLGYSYPISIPRFETKTINAYVSIRNASSFLRDTLKEIVEEQDGAISSSNDTIFIYPHNILFYKSLLVTLIDPSNDFKIVPIQNSDTQVIDPTYGNRWQWSIVTETSKPVAVLILKATGLFTDGTTERFDDKTIHIKIKVVSNIPRTFFDYLTDNPKVSIPILVGFLGFIGWLIKYYLGLKKKGAGQ